MKTLTARMQAARRRREQRALDRAVAHVGSLAALAAALDPALSYQAVQGWYASRVPLSRCAAIERATAGAVQCEHLREDYAELTARPFKLVELAYPAVYVAGPMSGLPALNFPAFHAEAARLRAAGLEVVNPAEINLPATALWSDYMRADLAQMLTRCGTVCLLPGWEGSRGAGIEHDLAVHLGLRVIDAGESA